jgi:hypothetical protein
VNNDVRLPGGKTCLQYPTPHICVSQ